MFFLFLLLAVPILWFIVFRFKRRRMYKLASLIPGLQEELPFIGIVYSLMGNTEDIMCTLQGASCQSMEHDGIVKAWVIHKLYLIMVHPQDIETVAKTCLEKDDIHRFIQKIVGNGSAYAEVPIWHRRRKINVPVFAPKVLEGFVDIFVNNSETMVRSLTTQIGTGQFCMWPYISKYTFDSVAETAMGIKTDVHAVPTEQMLVAINQLLNLMSERILHIWLHPEWLYKLFPQYTEYKKYMKFILDVVDTMLKNKHEELKKTNERETDAVQTFDLSSYRKKSFLDLLISTSDIQGGYTDIELREEILLFLGAGTDTTAVSIGYTLQLLGKYPLIQDKVYEELRDIFDNSERPLVKEDLAKLKYLERVIKESCRLFPSVPFILRKILVETKLPSGRILPAGSSVLISIWGAHRDPKYWGQDAEAFDPDRFLPERFNLQHACSYMPFSSGPRNCIGYQYAMMSMKTVLSAVLRRYRVVAEPEPTSVPHIRVKFDIMMKAVDDYAIALEKREP